MTLKLDRTVSIGKERLEQVAQFDGITVYRSKGPFSTSDERLYFSRTEDDTVVQVLDITIGQVQEVSHIEQLNFTDPNA